MSNWVTVMSDQGQEGMAWLGGGGAGENLRKEGSILKDKCGRRILIIAFLNLHVGLLSWRPNEVSRFCMCVIIPDPIGNGIKRLRVSILRIFVCEGAC